MTDVEAKRYLNHQRGGEHNFDETVYSAIVQQKGGNISGALDFMFDAQPRLLQNRSFVTWADADNGWTFIKTGVYCAEFELQIAFQPGANGFYDDNLSTTIQLTDPPYIGGNVSGGISTEIEAYSFTIVFEVTASGQKWRPRFQEGNGTDTLDSQQGNVFVKITKIA